MEVYKSITSLASWSKKSIFSPVIPNALHFLKKLSREAAERRLFECFHNQMPTPLFFEYATRSVSSVSVQRDQKPSRILCSNPRAAAASVKCFITSGVPSPPPLRYFH